MNGTDGSVLSAARAAERALAALEGGEPVALVAVVRGPARDAAGRRLAVTADSVEGTLGLPGLDERAVRLARAALATGERGLQQIDVDGEAWDLYVESQRAPPELVIVGAGHIAQPLCRIGAMIGFRVTVIDDRPEFASEDRFPEAGRVLVVDFEDAFSEVAVGPDTYIVLVTRGHKYDYECIRRLLTMEARPAYLGMIGSRRRVRAAFEALVRDGIDPSRLADVRAPIGLDIAAETPGEIAVAIAAEIVAERRGGGGAALTGQERILARVARSRESKRGGG